MFWVISEYFNVRNILPKSGTFPLEHPVYEVLPINVRLNIDGVALTHFIFNQDALYQASTRSGLLTVLTEISLLFVELSM